jgi:hypothetical protein
VLILNRIGDGDRDVNGNVNGLCDHSSFSGYV